MNETQMINIMAASIYAAGYRCLNSFHGTHEWTISMEDAVLKASQISATEVERWHSLTGGGDASKP